MHTVNHLFVELDYLCVCEASSDCCQLSVSPSSTAAEIVCRFLHDKKIDDEQRLYSLIAISSVGSEQSKGMY